MPRETFNLCYEITKNSPARINLAYWLRLDGEINVNLYNCILRHDYIGAENTYVMYEHIKKQTLSLNNLNEMKHLLKNFSFETGKIRVQRIDVHSKNGCLINQRPSTFFKEVTLHNRCKDCEKIYRKNQTNLLP